MAPAKLVFLAPSAILPGKDAAQPATVEVDLSNGTISAVHNELRDKDAYGSEVEVLSLENDKVLLPGLIDCHVHLNQPGRTAWEGFQTGTLAAISGGVTTLIDMPLNSIPPSTTIANLNVKRNEARNVGVNCDVGFWGGIIPGNAGDLKGLLEQGIKGFKCFMIESGVDEFPMVTEKDLVEACDALDGTSALILFHAEMGNMDDHTPSDPHSHYSAFLDSRPESLELDALSLILSLCRRYPKLKFHIVHLSASSALPVVRQARSEGVSNLTVETCFHYLTLKAEEIPENATQFKCCPPIRDEKNRKLLLEAVVDGTIDFVVSDHSPCIPELKKGDFMSAWGGISGLGLGLQLLWTELGGKVELGRIVTWLGSTQAKQVGLLGQKGEIKVGAQADFVIFNPNAERTISQDSLQFKNKISPYVGKTLKGVVESTWIRGQKVWDGHNIVKESSGQLL